MARDRDEVDQIVDGMRETGGSGREERQAQRTIVAHMLMRVDVEQQLGTMITNLYPRLAQRARCPASGRLEQRLRRDWRLDPIGRGSRHDPIGRSSSSAHHLHSLTPAPTCHNTLLVTDSLRETASSSADPVATAQHASTLAHVHVQQLPSPNGWPRGSSH